MAENKKDTFVSAENHESNIDSMKECKPKQKKFYEPGGWLFISYPVIMVFLYAVIGACFGAEGWMTGWLVFLTIPLFYTGIIAMKKKKPIIFCYPVLAAIIFLLFGFFANLWHPMWLVFLTIPIFYCVCAAIK